MRIVVVSPFEAGSSWAHTVNTVKMALGFARLGHQVTIICNQPPEGPVPTEQLAEQFAYRVNLRWIQVPAHKLGFLRITQKRIFSWLSLPLILLQRPHLVFTRSYLASVQTSRLGLATIGESHAQPGAEINPHFIEFVEATARYPAFIKLVTIAEPLKEYLVTMGVPAEKIAILPTGADVTMFTRPRDLPPSPFDRPAQANVVYSGHLYDYKGIPTLIEAAARLPDVQFHLVGGWEDDQQRHRQHIDRLGLDNVTLHGLKPHADIPPFLWHADVLLLTQSGSHFQAKVTSPVKLGEYLASGTPIVSSDVPAFRRWLTDQETCFVPPDDPSALAAGIRRVLADEGYAEQLAQAGIARASELSYQQRARAIIDLMPQNGD